MSGRFVVTRDSEEGVKRRGFLKGAALGGLAAAAAPAAALAQTGQVSPREGGPRSPGPTPRNVEFTRRDEAASYSSCGGDYMVDVIRSLGIEYFAATPGNTFMGLHESVVNYGMVTS